VSINKNREFFPSHSYLYYLQSILGFSVNIFRSRQAIIAWYVCYIHENRILQNCNASINLKNNFSWLGRIQHNNLHKLNLKISKKFWEELIAYFPFIRHGSNRKRLLHQFFITTGRSLPSCYIASIRGYTDTHRHTRPTVLLLLHEFVAAGKCLPSRCLATKGGIHFIEPLPSNDKSDTHTDTQTDEKDLWSTPLRWAQMPWYTYQVS
jgi:hypothetical protein